jgi:hypothetical protein
MIMILPFSATGGRERGDRAEGFLEDGGLSWATHSQKSRVRRRGFGIEPFMQISF